MDLAKLFKKYILINEKAKYYDSNYLLLCYYSHGFLILHINDL